MIAVLIIVLAVSIATARICDGVTVRPLPRVRNVRVRR